MLARNSTSAPSPPVLLEPDAAAPLINTMRAKKAELKADRTSVTASSQLTSLLLGLEFEFKTFG